MKFRKKPVVIEAIRWDGKLNTLYQLQTMGMKTTVSEIGGYPIERCNLRIKTLEGEHIANIGDWIIKGVKGEFYPRKPDIFEMTYEPVDGNNVYQVEFGHYEPPLNTKWIPLKTHKINIMEVKLND